ncbi:MAG: O-antigen ligase family protein [Bradyrhizobium sp.]|uniref:O-antigen ligase family protein n=1 Tax=Bradyrhizobium sp. TaxID=376 RepID=UPI001D8E4373|nr:O-antigen ligase family protein [Bradyrhizobium sp.]MBV9562323.1 O-antigen ligase family protein [Bradyrhizobium sp.]
MSETIGETGPSRSSTFWTALRDPALQLRIVDRLAALTAIMVPWSTTGVGVAATLWLIALVPTVEPRALLRSLTRPVSVLPIALFVLAVVGMLWSEAPWALRLHGLSPIAKFLVLPLFVYHFERAPRGGLAVFIAFLASCAVLALVSCAVAFDPGLSIKQLFSRVPVAPTNGIFVKDYIDQGQEFSLCAIALAYPVLALLKEKRIREALLLALIALGFVANMMFVITSRTALVTMPIMLAVFALLHLRLRVALASLGVIILLAVVVWFSSSQLRATIGKFFTDYHNTETLNLESGIGSRLIYWQKAVGFIGNAPVIGHGTGSTRGLFEQAAVGETGARGQVVGNPHNQTLNVAVQWGVLGVILLYAMWLTHLLLFRGEGLVAWIGLLVVVQNVFTSLFNSHLFDFTEGWIYVVGVGVAAGMTLAARAGEPGSAKAIET